MHSEYRTPKRRHCSLFQRMEQQIEKISRKLSAAKSTVRQSSYDKIKSFRKEVKREENLRIIEDKQKTKKNMFQMNNFKSLRKNMHFDQFPEASVIQTVRIKRIPKQNAQYSPISGNKTIGSKTLNKRLNFASMRENKDDKIQKLEQENLELSIQMKKLQAVCADQSHRMGYASAYFDDKCRKLEEENEQYHKQNIYLQKLCEHYKSKSKKYKDNLKKYSSRRVSQSSSNSYC